MTAGKAIASAIVLTLAAASIPMGMLLAPRPGQMPLADRVAMARADILDRPCFGDGSCAVRIASHGLAPEYYEGPDDWLESACTDGDRTACAYRAAWAEVEAKHAPLIGYGCEGFTRPLYGDAEDEMPTCAVIQRVAR